jgi:hypothetical protein
MKTEAISQILDTIAFILVTPEFLGGEKMQHLRVPLHRLAVKIRIWAEDTEPLSVGQEICLVVFVPVLMILFLVLSGWVVQSFLPHNEATMAIYGFIVWGVFVWFGLGWLVHLALLVISVMESILIRQISFMLGAALFLVSRGLMILVTWGGESLPRFLRPSAPSCRPEIVEFCVTPAPFGLIAEPNWGNMLWVESIDRGSDEDLGRRIANWAFS